MPNIHEENELILKVTELKAMNKELLRRNAETSIKIKGIFKKIDEEIKKCEKQGLEEPILFLKNMRSDLLTYDINLRRKIEELYG